MNPTEFQHWCQTLQLPPATIELISAIRSAPPSRRVQGRASNVSGTYPSRKMGCTIQFESHTVELWAIYQMEHDPEILEFYDQPPPFKLQYQSQSGRKIGHYHTPDFFVLRTDGAVWEEWKTSSQLQKLSQKHPARYQRTEEGLWRCPPGEAYAVSFGLEYRIRSDAELHPTFIQNLSFLEDYFRVTATVPTQLQTKILTRVQAQPGITLAAIMAEEPGVRANDIYVMIATEQLIVDLSAVPLAEHWRVQIYPDKDFHQIHTHQAIALPNRIGSMELPLPSQLVTNTKLLWDGRLWTLINLGETTTTLLPEVGQPMQLPSGFFLQLLDSNTITIPSSQEEPTTIKSVHALMDAASPTDLSTANLRYQRVQAYLQRQKELYQDIAPRTLSRWVKQFQQAETLYGCGYVGLLPLTAQRGNRTPKAPIEATELLDTFIAQHFETPRQAPAASVYRAYQRACDQQNITPLSIRRFYQRIKQRSNPDVTAKRQGTKAAYQQQPWVWELTKTTPRHGDRPLAIAHIDHTQLDIELCSQATGRNLGRPWLTLLIDAYSRRILAVYLTFDAPSYRSCMMVLRICVQRFGRFPQALVVDGGKEFHSVYFDTLLARYHCIKKTRPAAQPRFGSVIERLFGTTNTELVFNLLGNTQATKQARQMTKAIDPKRQAVWTLADLFQLSSDRRDFQAALLALLKQVPLRVEMAVLMQQWVYFYERSIGCVGVLKDWLVRAVAAALDDGSEILTLERLQDHALTLAQCERMAIDAVEGEQKLGYMESRRQHLWQLLQMGMDSTAIPPALATPQLSVSPIADTSEQLEKSTRKRRSSKTTAQTVALQGATEVSPEPTPKKKRSSKKVTEIVPAESAVGIVADSSTIDAAAHKATVTTEEAPVFRQKSSRSVGQRKPQRDPVGDSYIASVNL